ncbi:unnamed protein product [Cuscuta epithymum]|uniref:PPM-type phosphatase domain-containing protein n=1 Tax=Cuscuta epithymum TaxID=186058 RepID=A0AAV0EUH6_9ASTE|nr:unnamed protein product [Cuscuta epithymum]
MDDAGSIAWMPYGGEKIAGRHRQSGGGGAAGAGGGGVRVVVLWSFSCSDWRWTYRSQMRRKSKQTMKKAHLSARAKIMMDATAEEDPCNLGSASAIVINGERLVIANMGDYKAVICKDGEAFPVGGTRPRWQKMNHWSCKLFPGSRKQAGAFKDSRSSQIAVMSERIYGTTELVILASTGVWEVMKEQEAVNLIRHIEDPQKAAECLAEEASTRMSRSKIACLIIRFD